MTKTKRIGSISIIVEKREDVLKLNEILSNFGEIILGRMGIPYREKNIWIINIIVDGTTDEVGALTGKLGQLKHIKVKSLMV